VSTDRLGEADAPARPVELGSSDDVVSFVETHDVALVEVYRDGCGICDAMEPIVGAVAKAADLAVGTYNPRWDADFIEAYDVRSVPTLLCFVDGELVGRLAEGFRGVEAVFGFLAEHLDDRRDRIPAEFGGAVTRR